ncbi:MAG: ATP-binding protein [Polyangiaceae bacterium]
MNDAHEEFPADALNWDPRFLLEHLHDAVVLFDAETEEILATNARACELYGVTRDELVGACLRDFSTDVERGLQAIRRTLDEGSCSAYETVHRRQDGRLLHLEANAVALEYRGRNVVLSVARDVGERKRLEAELMQAQKLEAVGLLAAGVAHDFSNVLTGVLGAASMLARELGPEHPLLGLVEEIKGGAERGAALTQRLMSFGRRQALELEVLDLCALVNQLTTWLGRIVEESVQLRIVPCPDDALVFADRSQLEQILLNLVVNARDAMPRGGEIEVSVRLLQAAPAPSLHAGKYVELSVADNGHGMNQQTLERVFTPFFTTKEPGRGTGLGLTTVGTIARQCGGHVALESELERGTTVRVWLPAATKALRRIGESSPPRSQAVKDAKILVVEDEATARRTAVRILKKAGYDVIAAANADEARGLLRKLPVDLMVTDVMMPGDSGPDLARDMTRAYPNLRVAFMSGYVPEHGMGIEGRPFLQKPFTPEQLEQLVATALSRTA